jgi:hypothetical protein
MRPVVLAVQVIISLVLTASLMPVVLVTIPAAQNDRVGQGLAIGIFVLSFAVVAILWPRRKRPPTDRHRS